MEEMTIGPGYETDVTDENGADTYDTIAAVVDAHNEAAQPGEAYWGIGLENSRYSVYEWGKVPQPPLPPSEEEQRESLRTETLTATSNACQQTIYAGTEVLFGSGVQEHFSLQPADQTNIDGIFNAVVLGAAAYPYHADGKSCRMYAAKDIVTLYVAKQSFITRQTTYYNALRQWIEREESIEVLRGIRYGVDLPEDLAAQMQKILEEANEQVQNIVAKLAAETT